MQNLTALAAALLLFSSGAIAETLHVPAENSGDREKRTERLTQLRRLPATCPHDLTIFKLPDEHPLALSYYLYQPEPAALLKGVRLPLVVVLHHAGAEQRLADVLICNPESIGRWLEPEVRRAHPCYVVAPWSGGRHWEEGKWNTITPAAGTPGENARLVLALVEQMVRDLPIDAGRIYLVGQSMGAFGVWDLLERRPDLFAAAIPVCGGGDPAQVGRIKDMPIWAFHGDVDTVIPVERTRAMAAALEATGSRVFRYWEYPGADHDPCSERAWTEPRLADWLFSQKR